MVLEAEKNYIKFVANYLRKSRGEDESDLDKHRTALRELCEKNGWKYVEYLEIETGESIAARPVMQQLISDIEDGIYDAVCVVEYDRLGRGDLEDQGKIKKVFLNSDTLIVTPSKIYDLSNDDDDFVADVKGFLARQEYKMIRKRLIQGKKFGAKRGDWVNGSPPYPYEYERWGNKYNENGIVVNDDKLKIYRFMVEKALDNYSSKEIAIKLNEMGIPSPRLKRWDAKTVNHLLQNEVHLGKVITNKSQHKRIDGTKHIKATKYPKSEWIIVDNCHEPVKTQQEHDKIIELFTSRNHTPVRSRTRTYPLSGLMKCGKCGWTMTFTIKPKTGNILMKTCNYADDFGKRCGNSGAITNIIHAYIDAAIKDHLSELLEEYNRGDSTQEDKIKLEIELKEQELKNKEKAIQRINDAYEAGVYTIEEVKTRKQKLSHELNKMTEELNLLNNKLANQNQNILKDKINLLESYFTRRDEIEQSASSFNRLLTTIIQKVIWIKNKNDGIQMEVIFK